MLKCEIDNEKNVQMVESKGTSIDVLTDIGFLVNSIYRSLMRHDENLAAAFRTAFTVAALQQAFFVDDDEEDGQIIEYFSKN